MNKKTSLSNEIANAWNSYYQSIDEMRTRLESSQQFQENPDQRGKAYHILMELQAMAYSFAMAQPLSEPVIQYGWATDIFQAGQNCPDFIYGIIFLDGRHTYRLRGRVGDSSMVLLQTLEGFIGETANVTGDYDLKCAATDGSFDITLSATKSEGDWISLVPNEQYQFLLFRRALQNWHGDSGEIRIDRVSEPFEDANDKAAFSEEAIATRIKKAEIFYRFMVDTGIFGQQKHILSRASNQKNVMGMQSVAYSEDTGGMSSPDANYGMCIFELKADEALIIEMKDVPDSAFWSFSLADIWMRTLNYTQYHTSLNDYQASIDTDGSFRAILSHQDPGVANWLDTCGYKTGAIFFRNYLAAQKIEPVLKKIKFREIGSLLPMSTKYLSLDERKKAIDDRRLGQLNMYKNLKG